MRKKHICNSQMHLFEGSLLRETDQHHARHLHCWPIKYVWEEFHFVQTIKEPKKQTFIPRALLLVHWITTEDKLQFLFTHFFFLFYIAFIKIFLKCLTLQKAKQKPAMYQLCRRTEFNLNVLSISTKLQMF